MAITLSAAYLSELKKAVNTPNIIIELELDSGMVKWGLSSGGFNDVKAIIKSVSSLQNKIDARSGYASLGQISIVISGRDNFKPLISDEFLMNRRVTRKDGFIAEGFQYSDYGATFTGTILDWSRKGDELTLVVADEAIKTSKKIPVEDVSKTQYLDYRSTNPVEIMQDILKAQLSIDAAYVDDTQFDAERLSWLSGWVFDRVITKPEQASKYLSELQVETNSFLIHDGEKISFKHFAPPLPGESVSIWNDDSNLLDGSFREKSGYKGQFANRVVVYYDYDESGSDKEENFEAAYIATDSTSQSSAEWDETTTKTLKSKWIRTQTYTQPTNITGVTIYHVSKANGEGTGTLEFNVANNTLTWTAPNGTVGEEVVLDNDGKYQVLDSSQLKWVRVIVETEDLPSADKSDSITISPLDGESYAAYIANKLLLRYRDPVAVVGFKVDINSAINGQEFIKPTDIIDITTDEACSKGKDAWVNERMMLTMVRPDFATATVQIEALQTKMYLGAGFIAPAGYPDYDTASEAEREYAYIGRASDNKVYDGSAYVDGNYIW
jgi:hypothetical protein